MQWGLGDPCGAGLTQPAERQRGWTMPSWARQMCGGSFGITEHEMTSLIAEIVR